MKDKLWRHKYIPIAVIIVSSLGIAATSYSMYISNRNHDNIILQGLFLVIFIITLILFALHLSPYDFKVYK